MLVIDRRKKSNARAQLKLSIVDTLNTGPPRAYTLELYQQKCSAIFDHFYESHRQRDGWVLQVTWCTPDSVMVYLLLSIPS